MNPTRLIRIAQTLEKLGLYSSADKMERVAYGGSVADDILEAFARFLGKEVDELATHEKAALSLFAPQIEQARALNTITGANDSFIFQQFFPEAKKIAETTMPIPKAARRSPVLPGMEYIEDYGYSPYPGKPIYETNMQPGFESRFLNQNVPRPPGRQSFLNPFGMEEIGTPPIRPRYNPSYSRIEELTGGEALPKTPVPAATLEGGAAAAPLPGTTPLPAATPLPGTTPLPGIVPSPGVSRARIPKWLIPTAGGASVAGIAAPKIYDNYSRQQRLPQTQSTNDQWYQSPFG